LTFWYVVAFIFGINIGSFLNVAIWRLPRGGSIAAPQWSYCPRCEHRLGALDLIPVLSFLALGRKCRYCNAPISWRYPSIELLTGLLFVAVVWRDRATIDSIFDCLFIAALVCVFFIDLEHFVIPDGLNVLAVLIGVAHNVTNIALGRPGQMTHVAGLPMPVSIAGALGYAAVIYSIGLLSYIWFTAIVGKRKGPLSAGWDYLKENVLDWLWIALYYLGAVIPGLRKRIPEPEPLEGITAEEIESDEDMSGMGGGDGKLAAAIGANLGFMLAFQSFVWSIFIGTAWGLITMALQRRKLTGRTAIPFGPSMVLGVLVAMFFGPAILAWYYNAFIRPILNAPAAPPVTPGSAPSTGAPETMVPTGGHGNKTLGALVPNSAAVRMCLAAINQMQTVPNRISAPAPASLL